jgi:signal transduction histidine kinase
MNGLYPISGWGEAHVSPPRFPDWQNRFEFSFSVLAAFGSWRYRYRLEPLEREWVTTTGRTATYGLLPAGSYQFRVQAIDPSDRSSGREASFDFQIAPHLWQRWWFLTLSALLLVAAAYTLYRFRLNQLLEVERVRSRIATDLHDDIGSALSHIGLLSESLRPAAGTVTSAGLEHIASVSRETAAAMADIIWSVKPQHDLIGDLAIRIRRFAAEMCSAADIQCVVEMPAADHDLRVGIETRRQLLLVAKEAIHNAVRHAHASEIAVEIRHIDGCLIFRVCDNGRGIPPQPGSSGNGIANMRSRAEKLGGQLSIRTAIGEGTEIQVRVPVRERRLRPRAS